MTLEDAIRKMTSKAADRVHLVDRGLLRPEMMADEAQARRFRGFSGLFYYHSNRHITNFPFRLSGAEAEQQKETVQARKVLWKADQARRLAENVKAAELYKQGLELWRGVLLRNPNFHRAERFSRVEEETYEFELEYLRLIAASDPLVRKKAAEEYAKEYQKTATAAAAIVPLGALPPTPLVVPQAIRDSYYAKIAEEHFSPFAGVIPAEALPPNDPRRGTPWIRSDIKDQVKLSQGVGVRPPLPPAVPPGGPVPLGPPKPPQIPPGG